MKRTAVLAATQPLTGPLHLTTVADDYDWAERAAILEYDAADCYPTRAAAERRAAQLVLKARAKARAKA